MIFMLSFLPKTTTVRPAGDLAIKSGCGTGTTSPSANLRPNGRNGRALSISVNRSEVILLLSWNITDHAVEGGACRRVAFLGNAARLIRQPSGFQRVLHRQRHLHRVLRVR